MSAVLATLDSVYVTTGYNIKMNALWQVQTSKNRQVRSVV